MSYKNRTLEVSYNGTTWNFRQDTDNKGSNPTLTFDEPTYLYFVAVSNNSTFDNLTFDTSNPVTWDSNGSPKNSTTTVINNGCVRIIDPDSEGKKKTYSCVLNMIYNGTAVTTDDPIIVNKPNT
jgi:hypothetical protein